MLQSLPAPVANDITNASTSDSNHGCSHQTRERPPRYLSMYRGAARIVCPPYIPSFMYVLTYSYLYTPSMIRQAVSRPRWWTLMCFVSVAICVRWLKVEGVTKKERKKQGKKCFVGRCESPAPPSSKEGVQWASSAEGTKG